MQSDDTTNPIGLCQCGCGLPTPIATYTNRKQGAVRGQPVRFIQGHRPGKTYTGNMVDQNPSGMCQCGCGQPTKTFTLTNVKRGAVKGHHQRFVQGHHLRSYRDEYAIDEATGCWNWQGSIHKRTGYGQYSSPDTSERQAHRAIYERLRGPIPDGLELDHLCRNRSCVNPDHLDPVTREVNIRRGTATKLTAADVVEIRALQGVMGYKEIAARFGITNSYVHFIWRRECWKDIPA